LFERCFSINYANNLIEKSPTSASEAIINAAIVFLDGEDHPQPQMNRGSEDLMGMNSNISGGKM
jgi:hypothetical protein